MNVKHCFRFFLSGHSDKMTSGMTLHNCTVRLAFSVYCMRIIYRTRQTSKTVEDLHQQGEHQEHLTFGEDY